MSTIAVAKKNGYAAIGADTLALFGPIKETADYVQNSSKIVKVGESFIASVGHSSTELILLSYFSSLKKIPQLDSTQSIFETACQLHKVLKEDYFLNPSEEDDDEYESSRMDCLIANPSGIFGLYSLRSVQEYSKFYALGSGAQLALGAMKAVYENDLSAEEIVRTGLDAAAEFNDATGRPIEAFTVKLKEKPIGKPAVSIAVNSDRK